MLVKKYNLVPIKYHTIKDSVSKIYNLRYNRS